MSEREVSFLLKRRGLAAPGDHEQARGMAQEQRNQDMETARAMSVRELKEALTGSEFAIFRKIFSKKFQKLKKI